METKELLERHVAGERDFRDAYLAGADLTGADLTNAYLTGAKGIVAFYGVGANRYLNYCYQHDVVRFQIGCFNGTYEEAVAKTKARYEELDKQQYTESHLLMLAAARAALLVQLEDTEDTSAE